MAFEEWEQAQASAAERQSTHMQLNQLAPDGGGGGGGGDLTVHDDQLGALGNMAHDLRGRLSTAADHPRPATHDASVELGNDGLEMGGALTSLKCGTAKAKYLLVDVKVDKEVGGHVKQRREDMQEFAESYVPNAQKKNNCEV